LNACTLVEVVETGKRAVEVGPLWRAPEEGLEPPTR
jgi:hypothetical protein